MTHALEQPEPPEREDADSPQEAMRHRRRLSDPTPGDALGLLTNFLITWLLTLYLSTLADGPLWLALPLIVVGTATMAGILLATGCRTLLTMLLMLASESAVLAAYIENGNGAGFVIGVLFSLGALPVLLLLLLQLRRPRHWTARNRFWRRRLRLSAMARCGLPVLIGAVLAYCITGRLLQVLHHNLSGWGMLVLLTPAVVLGVVWRGFFGAHMNRMRLGMALGLLAGVGAVYLTTVALLGETYWPWTWRIDTIYAEPNYRSELVIVLATQVCIALGSVYFAALAAPVHLSTRDELDVEETTHHGMRHGLRAFLRRWSRRALRASLEQLRPAAMTPNTGLMMLLGLAGSHVLLFGFLEHASPDDIGGFSALAVAAVALLALCLAPRRVNPLWVLPCALSCIAPVIAIIAILEEEPALLLVNAVIFLCCLPLLTRRVEASPLPAAAGALRYVLELIAIFLLGLAWPFGAWLNNEDPILFLYLLAAAPAILAALVWPRLPALAVVTAWEAGAMLPNCFIGEQMDHELLPDFLDTGPIIQALIVYGASLGCLAIVGAGARIWRRFHPPPTEQPPAPEPPPS